MIFGRDLLNQAESKKIMLVLSDGYPAATYYGQDDAMLKHSIKYLENQGLILGSIGIESYAPKRFYKNNIVINQLSDLPSALTELCGKLMTDKINKTDTDPQETQEWLDSLESIIENDGTERAHFLIEKLIAYQLCSQVARVRLANMVDTLYSVVAKFPKKYLPKLN